MIELDNVSINLNKVSIIRDVTAKIDSKVILLGPNGSGKTTLLKAIAGIIPYMGSIRVNGNEVKRARNLNLLSTNLPEAYSLGRTVEDVIYLYQELKSIPESNVKELLRSVGFNDLKKEIYGLSAGQGVILRTVMALASDPQVVLLDEPFENVDAAKKFKIVQWLKEYGKEGIIVTHEIDMAAMFKESPTFMILEGRLYGPVSMGGLMECSIEEGSHPGSLMEVQVGNRKFSFVKEGKGKKMKDMVILDRIYNI